jgi:hypothetical protein
MSGLNMLARVPFCKNLLGTFEMFSEFLQQKKKNIKIETNAP